MKQPKIKSIIFSICLLIFPLAVQAQSLFSTNLSAKINKQQGAFTGGAGLNKMSFGELAALIIQILLSVIGVIFTVLIVYAGYVWMTARGNEERVREAQTILKNSIWGILVTLAAYSIAYYLIYYLLGGGVEAY